MQLNAKQLAASRFKTGIASQSWQFPEAERPLP